MNDSNNITISELLEPYSKDTRYVEDFKFFGDHASASCLVEGTPYSDAGEVYHLTAVEMQICLNQMLYCFFLNNGIFESFSEISKYRGESLFRWQADHTFVTYQSFKFKKKIRTPGRFSATLHQRKCRTLRNIHVSWLDFNFGESACKGKVKVAVNR